MIHVNDEVKSILTTTEPSGDYSLDADFRLGYYHYMSRWRPNSTFEGSPIITNFDQEDNSKSFLISEVEQNIVYYGFRPQDSLNMHEIFSKKGTYPYKLPSHSVYMLIDITRQCQKLKQPYIQSEGMTKNFKDGPLIFDSYFESGNLDIVVKVGETEYDLYMRTDTNARGNHQWFYFSVQAKEQRTIRFNILNFTKKDALYTQGMRIATFSEKKAQRANIGELPELYAGWHRGGENIIYKLSKLSRELYQKLKIVYLQL